MQYPFKIYSSSAGSGKTYTLTKEYLKLALQSTNAGYFKQILAITFTNDAANEMKERILKALQGFADEERIPENKRAANRQLLQSIIQELNQYNAEVPVTESVIRKRAAQTFACMLHDYSDFSVSTIDSFVNRLVSAFTEELNIPFNYEVDLDANDLLTHSIDRLLERVGEEEENILSEMLEGYAVEKADEGKSWHRLPEDLSRFGMQLLNERVFEAVAKLKKLDLKGFKELRHQLVEAKEVLRGEVASLADEALQLIEGHGLDSKCFIGGSNGIFGYFAKIVEDVDKRICWEPTEAFLRGIEGEDWAPKSVRPAQRTQVNLLCDVLGKFYETIERLKGEYILIGAILKHFYKLSVIHEINKELAAIKAEKNVVHISDFNKAIIHIVLQEPVPFIYERLGEKYNHILIDEFQDTSVLQWNNLLPLVENSLAKGHFNLVVGDAKQAIYGWRGGDMEQIVHLSNKRFHQLIENHKQADLLRLRYDTFEHSLFVERLSTNYRSTAEIVQFNNELFRLLAEHYQQDKRLLADVYDAYFEQQVPPNAKTGGHVQINFIDRNAEEDSPYLAEEGSSPYQTRTLETILSLLEEVQQAGYSFGDIAILNRSNKTGKVIANFLKENNIEVISSDSLLLQFAPSVELLVAFLRVIHAPGNILNRYEALHLFHSYILHSLPDTTLEEVKKALDTQAIIPFYDYLTSKGFELNLFSLQQEGIYELSEKIIQVFGLFEKSHQASYLFRFLDVALEFSVKQSNHLADFMEYWDQKKEILSITAPKDSNAVTVTSIHKAKGLEYPVVLVPFADWELSHRNDDMLWMSLEEESLTYNTFVLNKLPILSATFSPGKDLGRTPLQTQFNREAEKVFIESLNTLYVALTRPTDRLYLLTKKSNFEKSKKVSISYLLYQYLESRGLYESERDTYTISQGGVKKGQQRQETGEEIIYLDKIISNNWQEKARLRRKAATVFDLETFEKNKDWACTLCYALAKINSPEDCPKAVDEVYLEGLISLEEIQKLQEALESIIMHPQVHILFSDSVIRLAERDILSKKALQVKCPDRVAIQGQKAYLLSFVACPPSDKDKKAMHRYSKLLQEMGYTEIEKVIFCTEDRSAISF